MFHFVQKLVKKSDINRYMLVGVFNTLISYISFPLIYTQSIFEIESYNTALILSFIINVSIAFLMQLSYVFRVGNKILSRFTIFFSFNLFICFLNFILLNIAASKFGASPVYAQIFIVSMFIPIGYLFSRFVTFKK